MCASSTSENLKPILARLIAARKAAGLTQQEAAEAIGLTRASSLSDLETGRNEMKVSQLLALCELYHVSPARIMGADEDVPALLEHIEALEAELEEARDALVWISLPLSQIQAVRRAH